MCARTARSPKTEVNPAASAGKPRPACPYPSLYQVNTRVLLTTLSRRLGWAATLDDISDADLDQIAANGFDWVWFLGVWQTGAVGRSISLSNPEWRQNFRNLLPDFSDADVSGSCFAITSYSVHTDFGGNAALDRLRGRIHDRGMRLLLDFVPNHMAPDHPWARQYPDYFVHGTASQLEQEPQNYTRSDSEVLAYGRDPYFPGWPDTLQLNYANPALQEAMARELENIAAMCDGVRCDMAMLILPDVFQRTWGMRPADFWPTAIARARARNSCFVFMAEVYWDLEWTLQQQGFDYTYDKRLYDRLREALARPVRDHFRADMDFQRSSARFLENHDEPRAASDFPPAIHRAAAVLTFLCPGLRFIHQGQMDGFTRRIPVHQTADAPNRSILSCAISMLACSVVSTIPLPRASGNCWNVPPHGMETGQSMASSVSPGAAPTANHSSSQSTTLPIRRSATCICRSKNSAESRCSSATSWDPTGTSAREMIFCRKAFISICPPGATTFSNCLPPNHRADGYESPTPDAPPTPACCRGTAMRVRPDPWHAWVRTAAR